MTVTESGEHEYDATLRVFSERLTAAELRARLGEPSSGWDKGDPVSKRSPGAFRRNASWLLESGLDRTRSLSEHIEVLLDAVDARREGFDAIRPDCEIDVFCGLWSGEATRGGPILWPDLLARLVELELPLSLDHY